MWSTFYSSENMANIYNRKIENYWFLLYDTLILFKWQKFPKKGKKPRMWWSSAYCVQINIKMKIFICRKYRVINGIQLAKNGTNPGKIWTDFDKKMAQIRQLKYEEMCSKIIHIKCIDHIWLKMTTVTKNT